MASRMERYQGETENEGKESRTEKHKNLYQDFYTKTVFKEINTLPTEEKEDRAVDLNQMKLQKTSREKYHKMKEIEDYIAPGESKQVEDLSILLRQEEEPKIYDINSVLEQAKKNRLEKDELEQRRKLKTTDYNILANIKPEQLSKIEEKKGQDREEQLQELIESLTPTEKKEENQDANEDDLLSELLPSFEHETIISEELSKEILEKEKAEEKEEKKQEVTSKGKEEKPVMDESFYTRSMDLSDQDFDADPTDDEFIDKENPMFAFLKVFVAVLIVVGLAVLIFYFMTRI